MEIIIIPGSCSSRTNWFDDIHMLEEAGHSVHFLDLPNTEDTIDSACATLYGKLGECVRDISAKAGPHAQAAIITHSMGGMQLLNILLNKEKFFNADPKTFEYITSSKLFFTQVPLKRKNSTLGLCRTYSNLGRPIMWLANRMVLGPIDRSLMAIKKYLTGHPILAKFDFLSLINILSISNWALGTDPDEFRNLVNYYESWDISEKYQDLKAVVDPENLFFSIGYPDMFCNVKLMHEFTEKIKANLVIFPWCFHLPMHLSWTQRDFHKWVTANI